MNEKHLSVMVNSGRIRSGCPNVLSGYGTRFPCKWQVSTGGKVYLEHAKHNLFQVT